MRFLSDQKALATNDLADRASELRLDEEAFARCLATGESKPVIERQKNAARDMEIESTPVFFLGVVQPNRSILLKKRLNGALSFAEIESEIMAILPGDLKRRISDTAAEGSGVSTLVPSRP